MAAPEVRAVRMSERIALAAVALLAALALAVPAHSATFFRGALLFATGPTPISLTIADLDGDGRPDLVVTDGAQLSPGVPAVSVMFGNGDGTFGARKDLVTGGYPSSTAVGDLNGDGRPDLVVANYVPNALSVFLGAGDGTFGSNRDFDAGSDPRTVRIADINGDGRPDLLTVSAALPGNGDGTFGAKIDFPAANCLAIGDLDADGQLDLVTNTGFDPDPDDYIGAGTALLGNGDGTFRVGASFVTGLGPWSMAVADFNGDGRSDLVVANYGHTPDYFGTISVLLGNGDGTFSGQLLYDTGANPNSVAVSDLDGDGHPDIVTSNFGDDPQFDSNTVSLFLGNGDGTFRSMGELSVGENPVSVSIADLNGDGHPDLVSPSLTSNTVSVLLGNGDGTFGTPEYAVAGHPMVLAVGDLDGDGHLDAVTTNWGSYPNFAGTVSVLLGNGDGTFRHGVDRGIGTSRQDLKIADLDSDGRLDVAMVIYGGTGESWVSTMLGLGDGTFGPIHNYASGNSSIALAIADLNADGRPDAVTANYYAGTVAVLLGNGDGSLGPRTEFSAGGSPETVTIGDLNADGRPDVVTYNPFYPNSISVLLGNGDGTFGPHLDILTPSILGSNNRSVSIADVDADGRPDVVVSGFVLLGNGDGTFRARNDLPGAVGACSVAIADFDGDGRQDLALAIDDRCSSVSIRPGNGDGTFSAEHEYGVGKRASAVVTADLNGDGWPDLVVPNVTSQSVSVLLAKGPTNLSAPLKPRYRPPRRPFGDGSVAAEGASDRREPGSGDKSAAIRLALEGFRPNPAFGAPVVAFTLADDSPATIEVLDLAGRRVLRREVGALGAGRHVASLGSNAHLAPGAFVMRLRQAGRTLTARGVVVR
jgi:VCBS repeat protein